MAKFDGKLKQNEVIGALFNMIISQQVFADNIKGTNSKLVDRAKVDASQFGDTKLYVATDCLKSKPWGADSEAGHLLDINRGPAPYTQALKLDVFRIIDITLDNYMSKRAFSTEGTFASFNSVMMNWIRDTKRIYDATTYNAYVGTVETDKGKQMMTIDLPVVADDKEAEARLQAQTIAKKTADLLVELTDVSRDYNNLGFIRSYDKGDLLFVFNSDAFNEITKMDLPTIFHKEGLIDKLGEYVLPAKYFGEVNASATVGDGVKVRSLVEQEIGKNHYFAGDLIKTEDTAPEGTSYTTNDKILFKVIHKDAIPFLSGMSVGTSFFNARSLTENNYLVYSHNTLEFLENYPVITVKKN